MLGRPQGRLLDLEPASHAGIALAAEPRAVARLAPR
jgi:hypothetical protein